MTDGGSRKLGLATAVREAQADAADLFQAGRGEQLPLLPAVQEDDPAGEAGEVRDLVEARRGPGRPPGSRNRSTEEWRTYILSRYRSPLVMLAETYSRPIAVLAAELNTSLLEAFRLQLAAAKELAPYVHQRLPQAIEVEGKALPTIILAAAETVRQVESGEISEAKIVDLMPHAESEENQ